MNKVVKYIVGIVVIGIVVYYSGFLTEKTDDNPLSKIEKNMDMDTNIKSSTEEKNFVQETEDEVSEEELSEEEILAEESYGDVLKEQESFIIEREQEKEREEAREKKRASDKEDNTNKEDNANKVETEIPTLETSKEISMREEKDNEENVSE